MDLKTKIKRKTKLITIILFICLIFISVIISSIIISHLINENSDYIIDILNEIYRIIEPTASRIYEKIENYF
jgi:hypothetical protein